MPIIKEKKHKELNIRLFNKLILGSSPNQHAKQHKVPNNRIYDMKKSYIYYRVSPVMDPGKI